MSIAIISPWLCDNNIDSDSNNDNHGDSGDYSSDSRVIVILTRKKLTDFNVGISVNKSQYFFEQPHATL